MQEDEIYTEYQARIKKQISKSNFEEAKKIIQKFQFAYPKEPDAFYLSGVCDFALKDYKQAIESYEQAIILNPKHAKAYFNLGICYNMLKMYDEALINIARALIIFSNKNDLQAREKCMNTIKTIEIERK